MKQHTSCTLIYQCYHIYAKIIIYLHYKVHNKACFIYKYCRLHSFHSVVVGYCTYTNQETDLTVELVFFFYFYATTEYFLPMRYLFNVKVCHLPNTCAACLLQNNCNLITVRLRFIRNSREISRTTFATCDLSYTTCLNYSTANSLQNTSAEYFTQKK